MKFSDKVVIVTGGAQGIGEAIAKAFMKQGAKVYVFDVQRPNFDAEFIEGDISNEADIEQGFKDFEHIDIVVNNAGIYFQALVEDTRIDDLEKLIDIDFKGTYLASKHAMPAIRRAKGNIVNISSGLGIVPEPASPAYCSAKAAVNMLTKCMAQQYAEEGIRINAVLPGPIDTPLLRNALKTEDAFKEYGSINPMRKVGSTEDVAQVVLFLASNKAKYITGALYAVDGGESSSSLYSR